MPTPVPALYADLEALRDEVCRALGKSDRVLDAHRLYQLAVQAREQRDRAWDSIEELERERDAARRAQADAAAVSAALTNLHDAVRDGKFVIGGGAAKMRIVAALQAARDALAQAARGETDD